MSGGVGAEDPLQESEEAVQTSDNRWRPSGRTVEGQEGWRLACWGHRKTCFV